MAEIYSHTLHNEFAKYPIALLDFPGEIHSKLNFGLPQPTAMVSWAQIAPHDRQNEQFPLPGPWRQFC